jgi:uncharacterized protein (TIGR03437 family)
LVCGQGLLATFAGTDWLYPDADLPGLQAPLAAPKSLSFDRFGNLFVGDSDNYLVFQLNSQNVVHVAAGNGLFGIGTPSGPATRIRVSPAAVAADRDGNLVILDTFGSVRRLGSDGNLRAIASVQLGSPGLCLDSSGNIYVATASGNTIQKIGADGKVVTIAGTGVAGYSGDGGPATAAALRFPYSITADNAGNLYFYDYSNFVVRKINSQGIISTVAGGGTTIPTNAGVLASKAKLGNIFGLATDSTGRLLMADQGSNQIFRLEPNGNVVAIAGRVNASGGGYAGDGGGATNALLNQPYSVAADGSDNIYIADTGNGVIRKIDHSGIITTVAGNRQFRFRGDNGPAVSAALRLPNEAIPAPDGSVFIADSNNNRIRKVSPAGIITTFAGNGTTDYPGDGPDALVVGIDNPRQMAVDSAGNLYVALFTLPRILKITPGGAVSTYAGSASPLNFNDGGQANQTAISRIGGMAVDGEGNLYFSEFLDAAIRKVTPNGIITTVAGSLNQFGIGSAGFSGDGSAANKAKLNRPFGVAVDAAGNVYFADSANHRVRKIGTDGIISTVAGNGIPAFSGDGGAPTQASLNTPTSVAVDSIGRLFIGDTGNLRIRVVTGGIITTFAGGSFPPLQPGIPAQKSGLFLPNLGGGLSVDKAGNVYFGAGNVLFQNVYVILAAPPAVNASPSILKFSGVSGGLQTPPQGASLASFVSGLPFSVSIDYQSGNGWLNVSPPAGTVPGAFDVSADAGELTPGLYKATINFGVPGGSPAIVKLPIEFTVQPPTPPRQRLSPDSLTLNLQQGSKVVRSIVVGNQGSGPLTVDVTARTSNGGSWLSVTPLQAKPTSSVPVTLRVTADATLLVPGTYRGQIVVQGEEDGSLVNLPVVLTVTSNAPQMTLSLTGLTFTSVFGGGQIPSQPLSILNTGFGIMRWTAAPSTETGGDWLKISVNSGATDASSTDVPQLEISVAPGGLAAGQYFGRVVVTSPDSPNSPQSVFVVLEVLAAGIDPGPAIFPASLVFTGVAGGSLPLSSETAIYNLANKPLSFRSSVVTSDQGQWVQYLPTDANLPAGKPTRVVVQPVTQGLTAGVRDAVLTFDFGGGVSRKMNVLLNLVAPNPLNKSSLHAAQSVCTPNTVNPRITSFAGGYVLRTAWPAAITVLAFDNCGLPMTTGSVVASFSNGDLPISLVSLKDGSWTGTWQPRNLAASVDILVEAIDPDHSLSGRAQITVGQQGPLQGPIVRSKGVVNAASLELGAPVAPGALITIFGDRLATETSLYTGTMYNLSLAGTSVYLAGQSLPLAYVSDHQINAIVPFELPSNTTHQLIVARSDGGLSTPEPVTVAPAAPAMFQLDATGRAAVIVTRASGIFVADPQHPAAPGDYISIYATGLGPVDHPIDVAGPAPGAEPFPRTTGQVNAFVNGKKADLSFAGLAPFLVGLYQVNARIPDDADVGDDVPLTLAVGDVQSVPAKLAIKGNQ